MGLDCAGAQVGPVHVVGRRMMCNDHTKQAGPFARDGEQGWTGLLHHDLVAAHADGKVCRQQELKDRLLLLCELSIRLRTTLVARPLTRVTLVACS